MCGIVGFINFSTSQSLQAEKAFKELLLVNQVRGSDATGVVWFGKNKAHNWIKTNENATDYLARADVGKFFGGLNSSGVVLGHNRAKTFGANTCNNAHPFDVGNIIGVHNGTVRNKYNLCTDGYKCEVDSEALLKGFQEHGVDETVRKAEGAFSVVYLNKEEGSVNFIRNNERPMWFLHATQKGKDIASDQEFVFFGSEIVMLQWIVGRNGFVVGDSFETIPFDHYSFALDNIKPRIRTLEKPVPVVYGTSAVTSYGYGEDDYYHYGHKYSRRHKQTKEVIPASTTIITPNDTLADILPYELTTSSFLKNPAISGQTKRNFIKLWRSTHKSDTVNFKITDMTAIVDRSKWQIFGKLAGRKKEEFPVLISAILDDSVVRMCSSDTILRGSLSLKRVLDGGKQYEFIVDDVSALNFNNGYVGEMECV